MSGQLIKPTDKELSTEVAAISPEKPKKKVPPADSSKPAKKASTKKDGEDDTKVVKDTKATNFSYLLQLATVDDPSFEALVSLLREQRDM